MARARRWRRRRRRRRRRRIEEEARSKKGSSSRFTGGRYDFRKGQRVTHTGDKNEI